MPKTALYAFNGEMMCFVHVLLNALDLKAAGHEVAVVIEGSATKLVPELAKADNPMHGIWSKVREAGLISAVCRACSQKMGVLAQVRKLGLSLGEDMQGHPGMARYLNDGYRIITF
jgi:hypothetical protein